MSNDKVNFSEVHYYDFGETKDIIKNIKIFETTEIFKNFCFQKGYAYFETEKNCHATSGWQCNGSIYIYTLYQGQWYGEWIYKYEKLHQVIDAMEKFEEDEELKEIRTQKFLLPNEELAKKNTYVFTDIIAGEKCNNGGEYGFSSKYIKVEDGIYHHYTTCTCDFDACGTGYRGLVLLTRKDIERLSKEEEEVINKGCLY